MERKSKVGMEVPFIGSDSIKWIEASVPDTYASASDSRSVAPPTKDFASCSMIGTPPTYFIWRICERMPHTIEILELNADKDIPRVGLRIFFPEALSPFAYICKNEINSAYGNVYLLYVLSISGIAYLLRLKNISTYTGSFIFSSNEMLHTDTSISPECSHITAVTATPGCIVIGRSDGSVSCFKLGVLDENAPGFTYELRDEAPLSRLWGLMSRSRLSGSVSDLVVSDINGRKVVFVLHSDGTLRVWDVLRHGKLFGQSLSSPGFTFLRMWVGPIDVDGRSIALAILYTQSMEVNAQGIGICNLNFSSGDSYNLSLGSSMQYIPLSQDKLIDVKLSSNKIWVLKEDGLLAHDLISSNFETEKGQFYSLQETFIAEQLFQRSEHSLDDLYQTTCSIFSSKDAVGSFRFLAQIIGFVSSIVLRRLLHPGVYNGSVLRMTLQDYDKRWTDNEFQVLTIDELSKEILLLIEHEVINGSSFSAFKCWKEFCARYFDQWCKSNMPFSLYVDANNGAVGLIRENTVSLFRALEAIELLVYGNFGKLQDFAKFGSDVSGDGLEHEILFEVLRCSRLLSLRLGLAISPIVYESIVGASTVSSEDIVPRLLNTMKCGYKASVTASNVSDLGADFLLKKEIAENKNLRKFTVDTLISIHALCEKASGWGGVLNAIERYLNLLVPRKPTENVDSNMLLDANVSIIVQATSQVAEIMFESALSILLFLNYILDISGQVQMSSDDRSKIQLELIPMIHETVTEWLIIHFLAIMPSESYSAEDFSSQLSSLKIDSDSGKKSWTAKLGSVDFTLAFVLVLDAQGSSQGHAYQSLRCLPNPGSLGKLVQDFSGWLVWGISGEVPAYSFAHSTEIALCLLRHCQYHAVESLLMIVDAHLRNEKLSGSIQNSDGQWCVLHHLRGCSLLAQVQGGLCGPSKEKKVREAMRCFFRASSGEGAVLALQKLPYEAGFSPLGITGNVSAAGWKLHYYQWVMQKFEQYNVSVVACQFALAALEQVDEAVAPDGNASKVFFADESATSIKGRLWANVFKFALDLDEYYDAYCALVSNPDDESRFICLRRFVIVLYECGASKILCDSQLPFIGLIDKAEQELAWKAACSDISARPNPYKLLYAFEMHQQNWRKAATYIYLHSVRLKNEMALRNYQNVALFFQERLNGISAAINCLHLVHPMHAWIDSQMTGNQLQSASHPNKKARVEEEQSGKVNAQAQRPDLYIGIDTLEDEFVLTSAEYLLSLANLRWTRSENRKFPSDLVELLVETNLYDMAFTVVLRFWKDSGLKRELEKVFSAMTLKCCPNKASTPIVGSPGLLLTYSNDEMMTEESFHADSHSKQINSHWEVLEQYLEKYKAFHGRLPAIVAETLLRSDPQIELPLWLINMFKVVQSLKNRTLVLREHNEQCKENRGMTGQELNPATLFGLYVDYGRYPEATELLIEYIEAYASLRPAGVIHRKKPFATWFPYTTIERLWCQLEDSISKGQMTNQCEKLKVLLYGALQSHLTLLKTDSEDATAFA
ncbi:nuclear pore complex protein NUP160 isoform X4 [Amaranthus tricolor]|uniref:nuclear pore complex protein NUP160 isoform X4 n=1 Tax=Amaranthus tricolor TaxID=29722 RepID=UPI0025893C04|nr:nuclear pore complex protein NUP160 isoform X4 [Amaranthus tricolor]